MPSLVRASRGTVVALVQRLGGVTVSHRRPGPEIGSGRSVEVDTRRQARGEEDAPVWLLLPGQLCRARPRRQGPPLLRGRGDALGARAAVQSAATSRARRRSWCQGSCAERSHGDRGHHHFENEETLLVPGQRRRAQLRRQGPPPLRGRGDALGTRAAVQSAATSRTRRRSWFQRRCA